MSLGEQGGRRRKNIGIALNIDSLGGGFYGAKAWRIFMRHLPKENIIGCILKEGGIWDTLNGRQREFCIAVFGEFDETALRAAFESADEQGLAALERRFVSNPEAEPLVHVGVVDSFGRLVQDEWSRVFHDCCKDCGWRYAPKAITVDLTPELKAELESLRGPDSL